MRRKLLAMGNILMGDDGIAIYIADILEDRLKEIGIDVIYGETDIGYSITNINEGDYIILLDAAYYGKTPGEITVLAFDEASINRKDATCHSVSFLDLLKLYFPKNDGIVLTVEIAEIGFFYGPSLLLKDKLETISQQIWEEIKLKMCIVS